MARKIAHAPRPDAAPVEIRHLGHVAARDVLIERARQRTMFSNTHDAEHGYWEFALAGAAYAAHGGGTAGAIASAALWPWVDSDFKPHGLVPQGHRRNYVKAVALMLTAIEQLDRSALSAADAAQADALDRGGDIPVFLTRSEVELLFTEMNANVENGGEDPDYPTLREKFLIARTESDRRPPAHQSARDQQGQAATQAKRAKAGS